MHDETKDSKNKLEETSLFFLFYRKKENPLKMAMKRNTHHVSRVTHSGIDAHLFFIFLMN